jgi:hypothetical protein
MDNEKTNATGCYESTPTGRVAESMHAGKDIVDAWRPPFENGGSAIRFGQFI